MKKRQSGFTLIEMLVVIGIIGILAASLFGGYRYAVRSARKAKAVEAVSNAKDALEMLFQRSGGWPRSLFSVTKDGKFSVMDAKVAKTLFKYGLLGVDCKKTGDQGTLDDYRLRGVDRFGIADPWAQAVLKRDKSGSATLDTQVPSGGTIQNHLLYFAVDENDDGFVTEDEKAPVKKVRAKALAWCAGEDGVLGSTGKGAKASKETADNVYSWQRGQEEK